MHKIYENEDLMMFFKKRYCHCCGKILQRKRTERIVRKGEPEHRFYCTSGSLYRSYRDIKVIGKEYYCEHCKKAFSCKKQGKVIEAQKYYNKKILTKKEIEYVEKNKTLTPVTEIKKIRWFLLLPLIGMVICLSNLFKRRLSWIKKVDYGKLLLLSVLVFIVVGVLLRLVFLVLEHIDFINSYKSILQILHLYSFNLPTLCYINRKLKNNLCKL